MNLYYLNTYTDDTVAMLWERAEDADNYAGPNRDGTALVCRVDDGRIVIVDWTPVKEGRLEVLNDKVKALLAENEALKASAPVRVKLPVGNPYPVHGAAAYYSRQQVIDMLKEQGVEVEQ